MTEHAIDGDNLIGMVQSNLKKDLDGKAEVYSVGCVGYIEYHSSTPDGRYLINLKGITRFKIRNEINTNNLYRKFKVNYEDFTKDFGDEERIDINTIDLIDKTKAFEKHQLITDWKIVEKIEPSQLINSLAMICPFTISEKQRLLETTDIKIEMMFLIKLLTFIF